eukprot:156375-Chlamydomonas_euryale.AAC.1
MQEERQKADLDLAKRTQTVLALQVGLGEEGVEARQNGAKWGAPPCACCLLGAWGKCVKGGNQGLKDKGRTREGDRRASLPVREV